MACSRGHALAAGGTRDGSTRRCSTIFSLKCCHRSPHHQNTSRQHFSIPAEKGIFLTRNPRPSARSSTSTSLTRRAHCRCSCIRTRSTSPERVLWNWTTAGDGNSPTRSHGPSPCHAPSNHALRMRWWRWRLYVFPWVFPLFPPPSVFLLWFSVTNCIAPVGGISWFVGILNRIDDFYPLGVCCVLSLCLQKFWRGQQVRIDVCACVVFYDSEAGSRSACHIFQTLWAVLGVAIAHQLSFSYPDSSTRPPALPMSRSSSPSAYRW